MKFHIEDHKYEWDMRKLLVSEAIFVQEKTGLLVTPWKRALAEGEPKAIKALVYILKWRAGENPDWNTLDFDLAEVLVEVDDEPEPEVEVPKEGTSPAPSSGPSAT